MKFIKIYLIAVLAVVLIFGVAKGVKAMPSFFPPTTQTSAATSTMTWVNPGVSTSTLVVDSYEQGNITAYAKGTLLIQMVATSSNGAIKIIPEYAQNTGGTGVSCKTVPANCDWFLDGGIDYGAFASTSRPFDISAPNSYLFTYASSTNVGGVGGSFSTTTRAITINVPTRYARFVISGVTGGTAVVVWAQFVPNKERAQ